MRIVLILFVFFLQIAQSFAVNSNSLIPSTTDSNYGTLGGKFQSGSLQLYDVPEYIKYLTEKLVWIAGLLAVIAIIWGSYKYLLGGFKDESKDAKKVFEYTFMGLAFVVFAWMIVDLIVRFTTE